MISLVNITANMPLLVTTKPNCINSMLRQLISFNEVTTSYTNELPHNTNSSIVDIPEQSGSWHGRSCCAIKINKVIHTKVTINNTFNPGSLIGYHWREKIFMFIESSCDI